MSIKQPNHRNKIGLIFILAGLIVWALPFALVALDNAAGATKPADSVIGSYGLAIITVGPLLVLTGLILIVSRYLNRPKRNS